MFSAVTPLEEFCVKYTGAGACCTYVHGFRLTYLGALVSLGSSQIQLLSDMDI